MRQGASADKLQILPRVGFARSKQGPINRGHGAQYFYRPPPAGDTNEPRVVPYKTKDIVCGSIRQKPSSSRLYHKNLTTINWIIYTEAWPSSTLYALLTRRNGSTSPRFLSGCSFSAARRHARLRKHVGQRIGSLWNWPVPLLPDYYW